MPSAISRFVLFTLITATALLSCLQSAPAEPVFTTVTEAAADPDFGVQGEYTAPNVGVQIVALGKKAFSATIYKGAFRVPVGTNVSGLKMKMMRVKSCN